MPDHFPISFNPAALPMAWTSLPVIPDQVVWAVCLASLVILALFVFEVRKREKTIRDLRDNEERFRVVTESASNALVMIDAAGAICLVNRQTELLFGHNRAELLRMSVEELLPARYRPRHPGERAGYFARPEVRMMGVGRDLRALRKNGEEFPVEIGLNPIQTPAGLFALAAIVDISKRKEAEEEVARSRAMLRLVLDNIPQGVFWKDTESRYLGCNQVVATALGCQSPEQLIGRRDAEITSLTGEQSSFFLRTDAEVMQTNTPSHDITEQMTLPDGRTVWLSTNKFPMLDHQGRVIGILGTWQDITERKRIDEDRSKLGSLIEHSADFISVADPDGRITFMNGGARRMIGLGDEEDYKNLKFSDYVAEGWQSFFRDTVIATARERGWWEGEMQFRHLRTDALIDVYRTTYLIRDAAGRPEFFATVTRDITEQKKALAEIRRLNSDLERRVRERTADLEVAQRLARVGSWLWLLESNELVWTRELYRILGLDPETTPPSFEEHKNIFTPGSWSRLQSAVAEVLRDGTPYQLELEFHRPGGTPGVMRVAGEADRDPTGKIVRLRGTAQDITELRQAEADLRRVSERLTLATEAGRVGVWDWDVPANVLTWDQSMYTLYGITAQQFSGAYEAWQAGVHPDDRVRGNDEINSALRGERPFDTEFRVLWPDGSVRVIRAHAAVHRDEAGRPLRMIGTNWDITDIKRAEESIRVLNEDLRHRAAEVGEANRELEAFSYSVSHDLRAPLRAIDGFSRILMEDFGETLPPEAREYLEAVRDGTQQMGRLVDDLLAFSRLGRQPVRKVTVDTVELVRRCVEELRPATTGRQIEFRLGSLPACQGDPALLKQVWMNLLSNALKYSGKRELALIEIGCRPAAEAVTFFVRDNGVGFDMRYAEKLFGVFQRLHRAEEYEGTGVGLAIVQRIIRRHGGEVSAEAQPGQGATFSFTLPTEGAHPHG